MIIQRWLLILATLGFLIAGRVYHSGVFQGAAGILMLIVVFWNLRRL